MSNPDFTAVRRCEHCYNQAPMTITATYRQDHSSTDDQGRPWDAAEFYELLLCPACNGTILRSYGWHELLEPDEISYTTLYPVQQSEFAGLPDRIAKGWKAAELVRTVDSNAYGVLVGRVLEMVCEDQGAVGGTLYERIRWLGQNSKIPANLADVADGIREFRNIAAHAGIVELTAREVPLIKALIKAFLEYIYVAPELVRQLQSRLNELKST